MRVHVVGDEPMESIYRGHRSLQLRTTP
jgi:hypothetical protein